MAVTFTITTKRTKAGHTVDMMRNAVVRGETHVGFPSGNPKNAREGSAEITNAQLATIHTFGAPSKNIPPRPFMQETARDAKTRSTLKRLQNGLITRVMRGQVSAKQALAIIGEFYTGAIKSKITTGPWAANSARTVAQKHSSRPLIDTSEMRNSVTHKEVLS